RAHRGLAESLRAVHGSGRGLFDAHADVLRAHDGAASDVRCLLLDLERDLAREADGRLGSARDELDRVAGDVRDAVDRAAHRDGCRAGRCDGELAGAVDRSGQSAFDGVDKASRDGTALTAKAVDRVPYPRKRRHTSLLCSTRETRVTVL